MKPHNKLVKSSLKYICINNYHEPVFTETKSSKGGVTIFVKKLHETFERKDLKICDDEYESVWTEIKIPKSKNIIVGCIYRHPHSTNLNNFMSYLQNTMNLLNRENKEIYITGDFNIDLLKYEQNIKYQEFYNIMSSNGFLPQITLPTRITDTSMTLIDNIFSNTFTTDNFSGNLLIKIADHLLQFLSVGKTNITFKSKTYYKRNYTNFNEASFLDDLSIQQWENHLQDPNDKYNDFYWRLENCINRHAPIRKLSKKELKIKSKPWITPMIQRKIKQK